MTTDDNKSTKTERDAAAKAVLDNMARLKEMRLAREAVSPPAAARKKTTAKAGTRTASKSGKSSAEKTTEKAQALAAWLADQRSGGRRT